MATRELSLFADLDQGRLVQSFLSTLQATLPRFVFGDSIPVSFRPLKSNGNNAVNPWAEVDLTGKTVRIAIGNPASAASSGTFTLTYGGDTTAAISYAADGATIQSALNALASIISAGGVTVTRATTGAFRIIFDDVGSRTAITADTAALYPSSAAEIRVAIEGDGSKREIVVARFETLPAAYAELTDDFPVAASSIAEVRTGSVSVGAILSLEFTVLPYSGFYTLEIGSEQTLGIPWDSDAATLQSALELLSTVGTGEVSVSGEFPLFNLNFGLTLGDIGAMTIDMTGLVVPAGRSGTLNTNTAGMIELLNGSAQASAKLEIELYDIGDATTWTVLQTECAVIDDVIGNDPSGVTGGPAYVTSESLTAMNVGDSAPVVTAVAATNILTFSGVGVAGQVVNIFGHIYTAVATAPAADEFTIGGTNNGSLANLTFAINMSGGNPGTTHGSGGSANAYVSAVYNGDGTITLTALVAGEDGNEITTTTDITGGSFNDPTLEGGMDATVTPPYLRAEGGIGYLYTSTGWMEFQLETLGTL